MLYVDLYSVASRRAERAHGVDTHAILVEYVVVMRTEAMRCISSFGGTSTAGGAHP